mmetsp:Transcript_5738/g.11815  ORF Transcript_5738/g.11815 Transcript_5738/m.11815 type:complete len:351 (-) Transcript_5738:17-1069(-)
MLEEIDQRVDRGLQRWRCFEYLVARGRRHVEQLIELGRREQPVEFGQLLGRAQPEALLDAVEEAEGELLGDRLGGDLVVVAALVRAQRLLERLDAVAVRQEAVELLDEMPVPLEEGRHVLHHLHRIDESSREAHEHIGQVRHYVRLAREGVAHALEHLHRVGVAAAGVEHAGARLVRLAIEVGGPPVDRVAMNRPGYLVRQGRPVGDAGELLARARRDPRLCPPLAAKGEAVDHVDVNPPDGVDARPRLAGPALDRRPLLLAHARRGGARTRSWGGADRTPIRLLLLPHGARIGVLANRLEGVLAAADGAVAHHRSRSWATPSAALLHLNRLGDGQGRSGWARGGGLEWL